MEIPLNTTETHFCFLVDKTYCISRFGADWYITSHQGFSQEIYIPAKDDLLVEKDCIFQGQDVILRYVTGTFTQGGVTMHLNKPTLQVVAKDARSYQTF